MKVRELREKNYDLDKPFVIPPPTPATVNITEPATPSTVALSRASSVEGSPVKAAPIKSSPPKLRHPSRLHSRDLTDNTFRIYVKHYMMYAPMAAPEAIHDVSTDGRMMPCASADRLRTPRPGNRKISAVDQTPRLQALDLDAGRADARQHHVGFTLSYLRRVPELADMARRVVTAETKRRSREQCKKEGEGRSQRSKSQTSSSASVVLDLPRDKVGPKVKRLFRWVIVQLLHEGSIVLWDGPMHACISNGQSETSGLWKTSTSISSATCTDSAVFGVSGEARHGGHGGVTLGDELSDPETDEEGYMAVTPEFLCDYVEDVMKDMIFPVTGVTGRSMSKMSTTRAPPRATKEGILRRLHRDDRWRYIGEWQLQEALEHLQQESRAWRVGDGWELTG
ncbi:hypothetical protein AX15_000388 [Amanita polypyramis BW_CC]|nr:hypothetical protein AX15_000388 [Amanita polypyramis BW_CC]